MTEEDVVASLADLQLRVGHLEDTAHALTELAEAFLLAIRSLENRLSVVERATPWKADDEAAGRPPRPPVPSRKLREKKPPPR